MKRTKLIIATRNCDKIEEPKVLQTFLRRKNRKKS